MESTKAHLLEEGPQGTLSLSHTHTHTHIPTAPVLHFYIY